MWEEMPIVSCLPWCRCVTSQRGNPMFTFPFMAQSLNLRPTKKTSQRRSAQSETAPRDRERKLRCHSSLSNSSVKCSLILPVFVSFLGIWNFTFWLAHCAFPCFVSEPVVYLNSTKDPLEEVWNIMSAPIMFQTYMCIYIYITILWT